RSTLTFVSACLDEVPIWIRRARVVESDPEARVAAALPARLPPWLYDEPTRQSELHGLQSAYEALQSRVESRLLVFADAARPGRVVAPDRRGLARARSRSSPSGTGRPGLRRPGHR